MDILNFILVVVGGIMVYGAKYILKYLKIDSAGKEFYAFKIIGTIVAIIGVLRIVDVI